MTDPQDTLWRAIDAFLAPIVAGDAALDAAAADSAAAGLPEIQVSAAHGKLLHLLAGLMGARRILEIGTLGGISAIWMARALAPEGRLVTLELSAHHAGVARANLARAGLAGRVEILVGPALETLSRLAPGTPFDMAFIDADKINTQAYFEAALARMRSGGLIVVDNVIRRGAVVDPAADDQNAQAMHRFLSALAADRRVAATVLQTVGEKGHDGLALARVL